MSEALSSPRRHCQWVRTKRGRGAVTLLSSRVREGGRGLDGRGRGIGRALFLHVGVSEDEVWARRCRRRRVVIVACEGGRERSGSLGESGEGDRGRGREGDGEGALSSLCCRCRVVRHVATSSSQGGRRRGRGGGGGGERWGRVVRTRKKVRAHRPSSSSHVKEEGEEVRTRHGQGAVVAVTSLSSHVREGLW